jgi:hypothetical protein
MHFNSQTSSNGVLERSFTLDDIPGVLWSPASLPSPAPLVLMGHPGGLHKKAEGLVARAIHLVSTQGFHVAAIDAPGHGDRPRSAEDARWVEKLMQARAAGEPLGPIVSAFNASIAEQAVPEWQKTLDSLQALPEIDAGRPVGYSGMTLATEIGMRLAVVEPRIGAAVLGSAFAFEPLLEAARLVTAPVLYLLPWDDLEIDRESGLSLFDALRSTEKVMHVTPGPHQRLPWTETEDSARFFARYLLDTATSAA